MAAALGQGLFMKMCFMEHRRRMEGEREGERGWGGEGSERERERARENEKETEGERGSIRPSLALMRDDTFLSTPPTHILPWCTRSPTPCFQSHAGSGGPGFCSAPVSRAEEHRERNEKCWENKYLMQRKLEWSAWLKPPRLLRTSRLTSD